MQIDGNVSTPPSSLPTSTETSPTTENQPLSPEPEKEKTSVKFNFKSKSEPNIPSLYAFQDIEHNSFNVSLDELNQEYWEDEYDLNTSIATDLNKAFYYPPLNLDAANQKTLYSSKVYRFENLLDKIPPETFMSPVKKKNSRYKLQNRKKMQETILTLLEKRKKGETSCTLSYLQGQTR